MLNKINRRLFIKRSTLATSGTLFIPNFVKASGIQVPSQVTGNSDRKLIIIQLSGGNDGLNTVIPFRNDIYHRLRPSIGYSEKSIIRLNGDYGLNPNMTEIARLFDNGDLTILNNVGYPNPNRSHFRSMDIWNTGSASNKYLKTGWLGRYLDSECESCNSRVALNLENGLDLALNGKNKKALVTSDPKRLASTFNRFDGSIDDFSETSNSSLHFLHSTYMETQNSVDYLAKKLELNPSSRNFHSSDFGKKIKIISDLIRGGCDSRIYYTSLTGFDTHNNQKGRQGNQLRIYSQSLESLIQDLKESGEWDNTLILTFSEFGRRVKQNGSNGTDHGAANNVFLMGGSLKKPGFAGGEVDLSNLDNGDVRFKVDFRSIYAEIIDNWLNGDSRMILGDKFTKPGLV